MASIRTRKTKDGKEYFTVQIRLKGFKPVSESFKRKTDAKKWAAATEAEILDGRYFKSTESRKHTLSEMVDRYIRDVLPKKPKMIPAQMPQLERWKLELGHWCLSDITPALIVEVRDRLGSEYTIRGTQRNNATVVRYMAALSHVFTIAVTEWQWLETSPMSKVKKPVESRGRVRFLGDNERARLLTACKESTNAWLYTCVVVALATGMRQSELMGLKWQDVNLKEGFLILHETKNGERRRVSLSGKALELLTEHAKVRRIDSPLLFPSVTNKGKPVILRRPWENALKAAGIDDFHWHDLRHSCASYLAMNGATSPEIAEILGHRTLQMVKRYTHLSECHISGVMKRMNANIFG